jgi:signal transduction histidine kinase
MRANKLGLRRARFLPLGSRLFLSHLLVTIVGAGTLVIIGKLFSPPLFVQHLEQLEINGWQISFARIQLVKGFEIAWSRTTLWSAIAGAIAAGVLSYWVSKRIVQPLSQMEKVTQKFAAGKLDERLPANEIPELNRLASSFNRMAASLEGVEQRRRELVTDLTHELRTPLTVVRGYLEELADGKMETSPEIYDRLIRETSRLQRLVNDLQDLSKAEAGYLPIDLQAVNLRPILESLVQKFADQVWEHGPVLRLECPSPLPAVLADSDRVEQVLVNLLGNALTHTATGSIVLRVSLASRWLWVAITDTGTGIAPEDLPHVFERFWQAGSANQRNFRSTGVGLAISRRLIELQGGKLEVESQLGVGSTFRFCLPLAYAFS